MTKGKAYHTRRCVAMLAWCLLGWVWLGSAVALATTLTHISLQTSKTQNTIHVYVSRATKYHAFLLDKPRRLVLDLPRVALPTKPLNVRYQGSWIKGIRYGIAKDRRRLVFDLTRALTLKSKAVRQGRLSIIQLWLTAKPPAQPKPITGAKSPRLTPVVTRARPIPSQPLRPLVVVIDPGHGGKDPGASGPRGTHEKNVVLSIAKVLKKTINADSNFRAILTRRGDYYISLRQRLRLARRANADIFIAIHADAFINKRSRGASVFALSNRGASSEAARWLAEKENYSELGSINLTDKSDILRSVLIDLSQTATISASLDVGKGVLKQLGALTQLHNRKVEQARFVVLKSPDIPSLLIETGFISNPYEELKLRSRRFQRRLADAIYRGVHHYFWRHPLPGTLLAARQQTQIYRVKSGDQLGRIAKTFNTSVAHLKRINGLRRDGLQVGQRLKIPRRSI